MKLYQSCYHCFSNVYDNWFYSPKYLLFFGTHRTDFIMHLKKFLHQLVRNPFSDFCLLTTFGTDKHSKSCWDTATVSFSEAGVPDLRKFLLRFYVLITLIFLLFLVLHSPRGIWRYYFSICLFTLFYCLFLHWQLKKFLVFNSLYFQGMFLK